MGGVVAAPAVMGEHGRRQRQAQADESESFVARQSP
jgi:hypothetical protein